ncbi:dynein light chain roadblock-type 2 [Drosophila guanche]|uniref:Dynein light chain roadblock n=1 Tax=Drosophila guanche TaxID=7266 RepID=A0A3B0KZN2_DROGU|nr:dynein light chain roadblock-type 2 [Drosophila guanche]SPP89548.1 blast:Dynein light chain roadblock-type 2 [Drosophila guanche]
MSAEIEEILKRYGNYPNVAGIIIVDAFAIPIKTTMEYTLTVHYAALAHNLLMKGSKMTQNLDASNELTALRLRTLNHEVMIVPEENFFIIVVQKPGQ